MELCIGAVTHLLRSAATTSGGLWLALLILVAPIASAAFDCPGKLKDKTEVGGAPSGYEYEVYYYDVFPDPDYFRFLSANQIGNALVADRAFSVRSRRTSE